LCLRADPFVEVGLSEKGEHLLGAAGEVHLETVVKDLQDRFARVPFQVRQAEMTTLWFRNLVVADGWPFSIHNIWTVSTTLC
jgi:hypothetical protein